MPISVRCVQLSESLSRWVPGVYGGPCSLITRVEERNSKLLESEKRLQEERHRAGGAGAAPGEDAPGARQDVSLSESSPPGAKQVGLGWAGPGPHGLTVLWGSWVLTGGQRIYTQQQRQAGAPPWWRG